MDIDAANKLQAQIQDSREKYTYFLLTAAVVEQQGQCVHADERAFRSAAVVDREDASDALQLHFRAVPDMGLSPRPGATSSRTTDSKARRPREGPRDQAQYPRPRRAFARVRCSILDIRAFTFYL